MKFTSELTKLYMAIPQKIASEIVATLSPGVGNIPWLYVALSDALATAAGDDMNEFKGRRGPRDSNSAGSDGLASIAPGSGGGRGRGGGGSGAGGRRKGLPFKPEKESWWCLGSNSAVATPVTSHNVGEFQFIHRPTATADSAAAAVGRCRLTSG